jgi:hypothetical protein
MIASLIQLCDAGDQSDINPPVSLGLFTHPGGITFADIAYNGYNRTNINCASDHLPSFFVHAQRIEKVVDPY